MMNLNLLDKNKIPRHIAIIMDGNGRWAQKRNKPRSYGHQHGVNAAQKVAEAAAKTGVKFITFYAFSKENWQRPKDEVNKLMELLVQGITQNLNKLQKENIRIIFIGDRYGLPQIVKQAIDESTIQTKDNTGLTVIIALNYGARWEILNAVKEISQKVKKGIISDTEINEKIFSDHLTTKGIPDPDLLIRTSGENRISNFLLWQLSYTELYFTDVLWPDFGEKELLEAIQEYQKRERRYGKVSEKK